MQRWGAVSGRLSRSWRAIVMSLALLVPFLQYGTARADGASWQGMIVTAYCDAGQMADGNWVHPGAVAGGWDLPFGSLVEISGMGVFMVEDRGSAVHPGHLDVWMGSCGSANYFGRESRSVRVQRYGWWGA
ncbi:MAG TPA: 3D domain-containing protein [Chloroflexota bacterium]